VAKDQHATRWIAAGGLVAAALVVATSSTAATGESLRANAPSTAVYVVSATPLPGTTGSWMLGYNGTEYQNQVFNEFYVHGGKATKYTAPKIGRYGSLDVIYAVSHSEVLLAGARQAEGIQELPAIYRFNGRSFAREALPANLFAGDVAIETLAASSPNNIWAGGALSPANNDSDITLHFTGRAWVEETVDGDCSSVTTTGPANGFCIVYNESYSVQEIEAWNGKAWTADLTVPRGEYLKGVAMASPTDAWAVGFLESSETDTETGGVVYHFNGKTWTQVKLPTDVPHSGGLSGIAMLGNQAWALGVTGGFVGYVLHWTGSGWVLQHLPLSSQWDLISIDVAGGRGPLIAGWHFDRANDQYHSVLLSYEHGSWVVVPS